MYKQNRIKTSYYSLKIEGNTLTEQQITAFLENKSVTRPKKNNIEILNAIKTYENLELYNPLEETSFLKAHKNLMDELIENAGVYRKQSVGIIKGSKAENNSVINFKTRIMKYLVRSILLCIGFIMLLSCETENEEDRYPYYKFTNEDEKLIINYNYIPDQIIIYRNQFGEKLNFKILSNEKKKRGYYSRGTFSGGGGILQNYYDSKIIRIDILENTGGSERSAVNYVFSKNKGQLENGMNFPMWNVQLFSFINEIQDRVNIYLRDFNNTQKTSMNINGYEFNNVVTINSGSKESDDSFLFGSLTQNVNQIFYDYNFGIIQFNDLDGKEWKVIYPE